MTLERTVTRGRLMDLYLVVDRGSSIYPANGIGTYGDHYHGLPLVLVTERMVRKTYRSGCHIGSTLQRTGKVVQFSGLPVILTPELTVYPTLCTLAHSGMTLCSLESGLGDELEILMLGFLHSLAIEFKLAFLPAVDLHPLTDTEVVEFEFTGYLSDSEVGIEVKLKCLGTVLRSRQDIHADTNIIRIENRQERRAA